MEIEKIKEYAREEHISFSKEEQARQSLADNGEFDGQSVASLKENASKIRNFADVMRKLSPCFDHGFLNFNARFKETKDQQQKGSTK